MVEEVKNHCKIIGSLTEITEPCMKVAVYEREGMTEESIRYWRERVRGSLHSCYLWFCVGGFYPVYHKQGERDSEVSGTSWRWSGRMRGFGDEYNDIEMMKSVKYSFAMKNAKQGVREAAATRQKKLRRCFED